MNECERSTALYLIFALLLAAFTSTAHASAACWELAVRESGATVQLLRAIAMTESSMNPRAVNDSHQRATGTRDIGLVGVNTAPAVLRRLGVSEAELFDPCTNLRAGARILREKFERYGATWEGVGAYNASCTKLKGDACRKARTAYAWRVYQAMRRLGRNAGKPDFLDASRHAAVAVTEQPIQFVSLR